MNMSKNLSVKYNQEKKDRLQKKLIKDIKIFPKKKKKIKRQYDHEHYKNLSGEEKQRLVEYRKKML